MRRSATTRLIVLVSTSVMCLAAPAFAVATTKVQLRHTRLGSILVNSRGFTLYMFTRDGRNRDRCASIGGCPSVWPLQATNGRGDAGPGDTAYVGFRQFGGVWYALSAAGKVVK